MEDTPSSDSCLILESPKIADISETCFLSCLCGKATVHQGAQTLLEGDTEYIEPLASGRCCTGPHHTSTTVSMSYTSTSRVKMFPNLPVHRAGELQISFLSCCLISQAQWPPLVEDLEDHIAGSQHIFFHQTLLWSLNIFIVSLAPV